MGPWTLTGIHLGSILFYFLSMTYVCYMIENDDERTMNELIDWRYVNWSVRLTALISLSELLLIVSLFLDDDEELVPTAGLSMPLLDDNMDVDPPTSPVAGPSGAQRICVEDDSTSGEAV